MTSKSRVGPEPYPSVALSRKGPTSVIRRPNGQKWSVHQGAGTDAKIVSAFATAPGVSSST